MLRPWDLKIVIRRNGGAIAVQIVQAIIEEIRRGRLTPGSPLPGTRELAEDLGVNRKTVVLAYDELTAQGWLSPEKSRGTFVSSELPGQRVDSVRPANFRVARRTGFPLRSVGRGVPVLYAEDGFLTFDDGAPDTRLVPVADLARAWRK